MVGLSFVTFGVDLLAKPGGVVVGGVLCLALLQWIAQVQRSGRSRLLIRAAVGVAVLCFIYVASFVAVDKLITASVPNSATPALSGLLSGLILLGFAALMWLQIAISYSHRAAWLDGFYVHASNGFYIENNFRRVLGQLST